MRIGIDARELVGQVTGVGQYLGGLLHEWAATPTAVKHHFILYANAALPAAYSAFETKILPGASGTWWQQTTLASAVRHDRLDVFFSPQYGAPLLLNTPTVVVIYDVSFAAHPEWFRVREGIRLRALARWSAAKACAVVTISEFSRREIREHLRVDDRRIHVIPPGIRDVARPRPPSPRGGVDETRLSDSRLLYVGSIFNRRHVLDLIRAFAAVARNHREASLDIVGDNRTYPFEDVAAAIEREQVGDRIRWHRYATDEQLADLYGSARAFAFVSEYEGLGLTPLEALSAGAPPVLCDTAIARETCGDAALYVKRDDTAGLARAIETLLFDDETRSALLLSGETELAKYNWARAAAGTLSVLERCR
jgi:glycosyltransferase involved in cell wall biosynthesis